MSTQTDPYTINTTGGVTQDDIRVARDAADLDATATAAPDLTQLREARERFRSAQADMDGEVPGTEEWFAERDAVRAAREDVLDAVDLLLEKDDTP